MKKLFILIIICLVACAPSPKKMAAAIDATLTALPTSTSYPTYTPLPTLTPIQTYTPVIIYQTKIVTQAPSVTPENSPTPTIEPTITNTPMPKNQLPKTAGYYLVPDEISSGTWRSSSGGENCYWALTNAQGDLIDNHFGMSGGTMYISPTVFQVQLEAECGVWTFLK